MQTMPRRRALVAVLAFALLAAACAKGEPGGGAGSQTSLLPASATALPAFDFAEYQQLLAQQEGTPVVVNIWASWCGPCRDEAPVLARASAIYGDRVRFLGVDILDDAGSARGFIREFGWTYPSVFDVSGEIRDRLGLLGQPSTLFYNASGELVDTWVGAIPEDELTTRIERLLGP